jgi:tryptophan 2,3-dioxygenase
MVSKTENNKSAGTYNSYLKVSELKELQICLSDPPHHDEPLFIIIHQTYELWFKLVLHELDTVMNLMKSGNAYKANFYMKRIVAILKLLVHQIHILETMPTKDFLGFRYHLNPASGFQSTQFREIEFVGGMKEQRLLEHFKNEPEVYEGLLKRFNEPSLREVFFDMLRTKGFKLPELKDAANEEEKKLAEQERINELVKIYRDYESYPDLYDLAESFVDFDEQIFMWRTHHVTVVERVIGFKRGTGGSEGVGYLRSTLDKRCFPELWTLRTQIEIPQGK